MAATEQQPEEIRYTPEHIAYLIKESQRRIKRNESNWWYQVRVKLFGKPKPRFSLTSEEINQAYARAMESLEQKKQQDR